jgi:TRAP-type mannitol/chloroaromatic compound transport system substrate-binding protein
MTDWNNLENSLDEIIKDAAKNTDDVLATKIASITRLTSEEIKELFPEPTEVKNLAELMNIVKSAEERNNKINKIVENSEKFSGVILTLLSKFT